MKIAFLFDDSLEFGGTQRVINSLANYFATHYNHEIELINFYKKSDKKYFEYDPKVKITYLNIFLKYKNFLLKYKEKLRSMKVLKEYLKSGHVVFSPEKVCLSEEGLFISDKIMADFMVVE